MRRDTSAARNLLAGTITKYILLAVSIGTGVFLMPFTVRHLGKDQYGLWILVASTTYYFGLLDLGYGNGIVRDLVEADARGDTARVNRVVSTFFCVYSMIGLVACGVCALLIAFAIPRFPHLSATDIRTAQYVLGIVGARIALGYPMTVFGTVTNSRQGFVLNNSIAIGYVVYAWSARRMFPALAIRPSYFSRAEWRDVASFSTYLFIVALGSQISFNVDNVVVGAWLGTAAVAVYAVAARLSEYQRRVCDQFSGMLFPVVVGHGARGDVAALRSALVDGARVDAARRRRDDVPRRLRAAARRALDGQWVRRLGHAVLRAGCGGRRDGEPRRAVERPAGDGRPPDGRGHLDRRRAGEPRAQPHPGAMDRLDRRGAGDAGADDCGSCRRDDAGGVPERGPVAARVRARHAGASGDWNRARSSVLSRHPRAGTAREHPGGRRGRRERRPRLRDRGGRGGARSRDARPLSRTGDRRVPPGVTVSGEVPMRGLPVTLALLASTAVLSAQQRSHGTPPASRPASHPTPPQSTWMSPPPPPIVLPLPPLPAQPTGGFTSGFVFPPQIHPAYTPGRSGIGGRGNYNGYGYGYGGGYFSMSDTQPAPAAPAPVDTPTGMLRLTGTPSEAQVFVDGFYVTTLGDAESQRALTLPAGAHHIELRAPDYTADRFDVRIDPGAPVTYRASLDHVRVAPPRPAAAPAGGAMKMYVIPNCYLGNVPPKPERLPQGCDITRVQVIS
jgi:hypothetical protein